MAPVAGRHDEQGALRKAIDEVTAQRPCAWFVHGEPGAGKTRLVAEACREAEERGFTVLWGACVHFGAAMSPYAPLVPAFEHWLTAADDRTRNEATADLETLADEHGGTAPSGGVLHAAARLLNRIESRGPVFLVVDDLQWADVSSLDVLAYLIAGLDRQRIGLLVTYRDTELPDGHPLHGWLADLRRLPQVHDLRLGRLVESGTEEQLAGLLGRRPPTPLVAAVHERSGGNPYLNELLVRELPPDTEALPADLPSELREVLLASWHRLGPTARAVVRLLAVGGRPLPYPTFTEVAAVAGHDPAVVAAVLVEGVRAGVLTVTRSATYWFRHPLLADVLYGTFLPGEASREHAAFAEVLEQLSAADDGEEMQVLADLALHHQRSGDPDRAFCCSIRAADRAQQLQGYPETAQQLLRAVELLPRVRAETVAGAGGEVLLLERAAYACSRTGDPLTAHRLATHALGKIDRAAHPLAAARLLDEWCLLVWRNCLVERPPLAQLLDAAELSSADPDSPEHVRSLAILARAEFRTGLVERAERHAGEALAAAERVATPQAMVDALEARCLIRLRDTSAWQDVVAAGEWAERTDDVLVRVAACGMRVTYLEAHGRLRDLPAADAEGFAASTRCGSRDFQAWFAGMAARHAMELGRFDDSRRWLREGMTVRSAGHGAAQVRRSAATLAIREGRLDEARNHLDRLLNQSPGFEHRADVGPPALVEYHLAVGDAERALRIVEVGLTDHGAVDPRLADRLLVWGVRAAADLARLGLDTGDDELVDGARRRAEGLAALRDTRVVPAFERTDEGDLVAPAREALFRAESARLDAPAGDPERWRQAAEASATAGLRWSRAVTLRWLGESLLVGDVDRGDAAEALRSAHELAADMGAAPLRTEVEEIARTARISLEPVPVPTNGRYDGSPLRALTRRELEVLGHLVAGRSYSEIARALFISDKTVSVHVSNLLRKTATRNRNEAAALGRRHGIVP
ncbi:MAG TPA: AAA family ATPase [Nocardioidaceae bacterium]